MVEYKGIELVDPKSRQAQQALTEALWLKLKDQGLKDDTPGRIECFFLAGSDVALKALLPAFPNWEHHIAKRSDTSGELSISLSHLL